MATVETKTLEELLDSTSFSDLSIMKTEDGKGYAFFYRTDDGKYVTVAVKASARSEAMRSLLERSIYIDPDADAITDADMVTANDGDGADGRIATVKVADVVNSVPKKDSVL